MDYFNIKGKQLSEEEGYVVEEPPRLVWRIISYLVKKRTNIFYDFQHPKRIGTLRKTELRKMYVLCLRVRILVSRQY